MRLLWFNLAIDEEDPLLGFAVRWIEETASLVERIDVITMRQGKHRLPPNVRVFSVGKEYGYSRARRLVAFYRHLFRVLRGSPPPDGAFSHMIPVFSALAAPALRVKRIPLVTWFAHPALTWKLKLAHWLSNKMVASVYTAYPYRKDKLVVIGQGIDPRIFHPTEDMPETPPLILCVGRISPVKDQITLIRAASILLSRGWDFRMMIVGNEMDKAYAEALRRAVDEEKLGNRVTFTGPLPYTILPEIYRKAWVHVNLTPTGFGDKVAWEAMACGRPSLVANEGYRETLGPYAPMLMFRHGDAVDLAYKLEQLLRRSPQEIVRMGKELSMRTLEQHGLPQLARRVIEVIKHASDV